MVIFFTAGEQAPLDFHRYHFNGRGYIVFLVHISFFY